MKTKTKTTDDKLSISVAVMVGPCNACNDPRTIGHTCAQTISVRSLKSPNDLHAFAKAFHNGDLFICSRDKAEHAWLGEHTFNLTVRGLHLVAVPFPSGPRISWTKGERLRWKRENPSRVLSIKAFGERC